MSLALRYRLFLIASALLYMGPLVAGHSRGSWPPTWGQEEVVNYPEASCQSGSWLCSGPSTRRLHGWRNGAAVSPQS